MGSSSLNYLSPGIFLKWGWRGTVLILARVNLLREWKDSKESQLIKMRNQTPHDSRTLVAEKSRVGGWGMGKVAEASSCGLNFHQQLSLTKCSSEDTIKLWWWWGRTPGKEPFEAVTHCHLTAFTLKKMCGPIERQVMSVWPKEMAGQTARNVLLWKLQQ